MAIVAPFRGMTYSFETLDDPSSLMAPPYDVITAEEQEAYYQAHPYNVIRLILGKGKTGDTDWDNRYTRAAEDFKRWESNTVLLRSNTPSMYMTSLTFDPGDGNGSRTRWGLIALVRIEDEGSAVILPHEKTFSAHKDDRFRLMRACNAQFSQIFTLYEDPENEVMGYLKEVMETRPRISFEFHDRTRHRMWTVRDKVLMKKIAEALRHRPFYIADGHHRYETARNYRNVMGARYGEKPPNRAFEYVMMYLTSMNDQGLLILPSHRLIKKSREFQLGPFLHRIQRWFDIAVASPGASSASGLKEALGQVGRNTAAFGFHVHGNANYFLLSLKEGMRDEWGDDFHPSLRKLDVHLLSRLILEKGLGFSKEDLDNDGIFHYESDMAKAISQVDDGSYQMAFLLNPTRIEQVKEVAEHSLMMPRKSTYFYPKVITGLVFNKIDPLEIIQIL